MLVARRAMMRPRLFASPHVRLMSKATLVKSLAADQKALADAVASLGDAPAFAKVKALTEEEPYKSTMAKVKGEDLSWTWSMLESSPAKAPVTVALSGADTPAGAAALYRIAAGEMLGLDQPVVLNVLGAAPDTIKDVEACGFPLLKAISSASSESAVMSGAAYALLLGGDFAALGKAAPKGALVAALGCAGASAAAKGSAASVTGITRGPQLAAEVQLAAAAGVSPSAVSHVISWGSGIVDISHATVAGKWALRTSKAALPEVGEISAAMQADAAVMHMKDWALGSGGEWASMGVPAVGDYGMGEGFYFSVPCTCTPGEYKRIGGVTMTPEVATALEADRVAVA